MSFTIDKRSEKKVRKSIKLVWNTEQVELIKSGIDSLPKSADVYMIVTPTDTLGIVYLGKANSRTDKIDFSIIFDKDASVRKVDVVKYRENHGREVASKRWLKQFIGKTNGIEMEYKKDISAISGATISVKSMTKSIEEASVYVASKNDLFYE